MLSGPRPRAGRHADEWFESAVRPWRRKQRRAFVRAALPAGAVVLAPALLWPHLWLLYAGAAIGMLLTVYAVAMDSPPEWIERKRRGRDGERRTEARLRVLEGEGWVVAHDMATRFGNNDHVAVGPGGAFLLETKAYTGTLVIAEGSVEVRRGADDRDAWSPRLERRLRAAAAELRRELGPAGVRWVTPVVVLWCEFPEGVGELNGVTYVHGDRLVGWLRDRAPCLPAPTVAAAAARLAV